LAPPSVFRWRVTRSKWLNRLIDFTTHPNSDPDGKEANSGLIALKKLALEVLAKDKGLGIDPRAAFDKIVSTGPTLESDAFFKETILPLLSVNELHDVLIGGTIRRVDLRVALTRQVIESKLQELKAAGLPPAKGPANEIFRLIKEINPESSAEKDILLEELAWDLKLSDRMLTGMVESQKSANPFAPGKITFPQWASAALNIAGKLSNESRWELVRFLRVKDGSGTLEKVREELRKMSLDELIKGAEAFGVLAADQAKDSLRDLAIEQFISHLEKFALESSTLERVPLIDALLNAGKEPLARSSRFLDHILYEELRFTPKSTNDRLLRAFLSRKVTPEHEKTVTLAYMLANSQGGNLDAASLFQMGRTVGIKFGQQANIWDLFGKTVSEQTKKLKDNAGALPKATIERLLEKEKSNNPAFRSIKSLDAVLGSASVKTVVLVTLENGDRAVLMIRNPAIKGQIRANLRASKSLIAALKKDGILEGSEFFELLVNALEGQIMREIEFSHEVEMLDALRPALANLNRQLGSKLGGWTLRTVAPVSSKSFSDEMALMTLAQGVPFEKLDKSTQAAAGPAIVQASLALLFRHGIFEPDRHVGNFFVDSITKTITFIDAGQLERYKMTHAFAWDDRLTVAKFLMAFRDKDAKSLLESIKLMSHPPEAGTNDTLMLAQIKKLLASPNADQAVMLQSLVKSSAEHGLKLKQEFSFGIIKGFMTLVGENYVDTNTFKAILENEIRNLYLHKPMHAIPAALKQLGAQ
jgi:predicted unusual protein kinase regulating ubiquinone biosynthesis (AarF/ABC1/UbiB family)